MSGIQIFTESPISTAVKNEAATPSTSAAPPQPSQTQQPPTSAAFPPQPTTFLPTEPSINPPTPQAGSFPQPQGSGANYVPATSIPQSQANPQRSNSLTPFTESPKLNAASSLEAPQVPRSRSVSPNRNIPPPPKVGEKMKPTSYYSPAATPTYAAQTASYNQTFPYQTGTTPNTATFAQQQQQGMLSPHPNGLVSPAPYQGTGNILASPVQTPTTATNSTFQNQAQPQQASFEHPPGYVQNPYAADMTPEQRFASQHGARSPTLGYNNNNNPGGFTSPNPFSSFASASSSMARPSVGGGDSSSRSGVLDSGIDGAGVWNVVSGWAKTVTKKASEVEGEVWKRINGDQ